MWKCPICSQEFVHKNSNHSCKDKTVEDFFVRKPIEMRLLFDYFISEYRQIGEFKLHPAKARIGFAAQIRFGYLKYIGKDFIDIAFTFNKAYRDNLCFYRIGEVPGGKYFQHYLRLMRKEDINEEVKIYMKMALDFGNRAQT